MPAENIGTTVPTPTKGEHVADYGDRLGAWVSSIVALWQNESPRTQQSTMRVLGMSELGGCREYIRASVAGDPKGPSTRVKWAAALGTWIGDGLEQALVAKVKGARAQSVVTVHLPLTNITVTGHTDAILLRKRLIDFKTRDGIDDVMKEGAKFKELVQISGYLLAAVRAGELDKDATGHLIYVDRSGNTPHFWVVSVTYEEAQGYLHAADERLLEVARALATGYSQGYLRDEPESWCFHVECPFYATCWDGYTPADILDHPDHEAAAAKYDEARAEVKKWTSIQRNARKHFLPDGVDPVEGLTESFSVKWTMREDGGTQIDLRRRRPGDTTIPLETQPEEGTT